MLEARAESETSRGTSNKSRREKMKYRKNTRGKKGGRTDVRSKVLRKSKEEKRRNK